MAYIGNSPANVGNYQIVDDISGSFDGSLVTFALTTSSSSISPAKSGQLLVGVNGVMQQPDDTGTNGFKVSGSNIIFSSAPASSSTFWAVYQGQDVDIGTPSNSTVGLTQLSATGTASSTTFLRGDNTWVVPTDTDTDTTYSAGTGLDISGTTFSVEPDLRDGITHVGLDAGDYIGWTNNTHQSFFVNAGERVRIEADGDIHADGDVIAYSTTISDRRLKDNIQPIENALDKVKQLNGCTFTYIADGKDSAGLIAQDVEKVLPSAVTEKELPLKVDDGKEYKVLQYDQLFGLLVESIKEQQVQIEELQAKLK